MPRHGKPISRRDRTGSCATPPSIPGKPGFDRDRSSLFHSRAGDFHCGLRAFDREAILALDLRTTGMEFASEMVVKATLHKLSIAEVPITLSPDGRSRPPHLRSWRDGWRHLRFPHALQSALAVSLSGYLPARCRRLEHDLAHSRATDGRKYYFRCPHSRLCRALQPAWGISQSSSLYLPRSSRSVRICCRPTLE